MTWSSSQPLLSTNEDDKQVCKNAEEAEHLKERLTLGLLFLRVGRHFIKSFVAKLAQKLVRSDSTSARSSFENNNSGSNKTWTWEQDWAHRTHKEAARCRGEKSSCRNRICNRLQTHFGSRRSFLFGDHLASLSFKFVFLKQKLSDSSRETLFRSFAISNAIEVDHVTPSSRRSYAKSSRNTDLKEIKTSKNETK